MKNLFKIFMMLVFLSGAAKSQEAAKGDATAKPEVFNYVEQMPAFPGGQQSMNDYLIKNIKYPKKAQEANIEGKVFVSFIVREDGKITDANVVRGIDPDLNAEALRVVKAMPNWTPGKQSGKNVAVRFNLPINFKLDDAKADPVLKGRKKNN